MNRSRHLLTAALAGSTLLLGACATPMYNSYGTPYGTPYGTVVPREQYGVVEHIDIYPTDGGAPIGVGALLGGVAGGVLGHQIGGGTGNTVATIAGAIGGAMVGNEVQRQNRVEGSRYRITVRTDSGSIIQLDKSNDLNLRVGDRVRIEGDRAYRM